MMNETLIFQFSGRADIKRKERHPDNHDKEMRNFPEKIIHNLNNDSLEIANEISRELKRIFPPGIKVDTEIDFSLGSVEWEGFVKILDWMARLGSSIGLFVYMKKAIESIINRVLRKYLREEYEISINSKEVSTEVLVIPELTRQGTDIIGSFQPQNNNSLYRLLIINTALLVAILIYMIAQSLCKIS